MAFWWSHLLHVNINAGEETSFVPFRVKAVCVWVSFGEEDKKGFVKCNAPGFVALPGKPTYFFLPASLSFMSSSYHSNTVRSVCTHPSFLYPVFSFISHMMLKHYISFLAPLRDTKKPFDLIWDVRGEKTQLSGGFSPSFSLPRSILYRSLPSCVYSLSHLNVVLKVAL